MEEKPQKRSYTRKSAVEAESNHAESLILPASGAIPERDTTIERVADLSTFDAKADELAFMEEKVKILIHESTDDSNPEPQVFLSVNGEGPGPHNIPWVPRGVEVTVKRKFVGLLARAKRVGIKTPEVTINGERTTEIRKRSSLAYPFNVMEDRNPKGPGWLKQILAEA